MTSVASHSPIANMQATIKAANSRAMDGDYKTAGVGHAVKDSDGDYKATPTAGTGAAARTASSTLAAVMSLSKGG